jgi:hypothetical protein
MRRGDKVAAILFALALGVPFLGIVVLGDGRPHNLSDPMSEVWLFWLALAAVGGLVFYAHTVAEEAATH